MFQYIFFFLSSWTYLSLMLFFPWRWSYKKDAYMFNMNRDLVKCKSFLCEGRHLCLATWNGNFLLCVTHVMSFDMHWHPVPFFLQIPIDRNTVILRNFQETCFSFQGSRNLQYGSTQRNVRTN